MTMGSTLVEPIVVRERKNKGDRAPDLVTLPPLYHWADGFASPSYDGFAILR